MKTKEIFETNNIIPEKVNNELDQYRKRVYSQNGEDGIIEELLNRFDISKKYYVEFGGWDGFSFSNTANLRVNKEWEGILFEGDLKRVNSADKSINIHCEFITSKNVNQIFEKYDIPKEFGLLSIDIDGDDAYVFESLDTNKFSPDIIVIEFNPGLPNHMDIKIKEMGNTQTQEIIDKGYYGANLYSLYDIAKSKGYEFVTTVDWNVIFIKENLFDKLNVRRYTKEEVMKYNSTVNGGDFWKKIIINYDFKWEVK